MRHVALILAFIPVCHGGLVEAWTELDRTDLKVTSGEVRELASGLLATKSAEMRAVSNTDKSPYLQSARLWFRYRGESESTKQLGSGLVFRQIGLKLRAQDPCNLVYVMWRQYPSNGISIKIKRNPGQHTSDECGNNGYQDVAFIPLFEDRQKDVRDHRTHVLEAKIVQENNPNGTFYRLSVFQDDAPVWSDYLDSNIISEINGPSGVRSDNGDYVFNLWVE
jgi:hypothetical protein